MSGRHIDKICRIKEDATGKHGRNIDRSKENKQKNKKFRGGKGQNA
jgi:hypothetical protein